MSSPSSYSSTEQRDSPFSLDEFSELVALALDADRFSETFLPPDPEFQFLVRPISTSLSVHERAHNTVKNAPPESPMSSRTTRSSSVGAGAAPHDLSVSCTSRPRQIFEKIRRHASALVLRPSSMTSVRTRERPQSTVSTATTETLQPIPLVSHYTRSILSNASSEEDEDFIPYLPLVTQYERAAKEVGAAPPMDLDFGDYGAPARRDRANSTSQAGQARSRSSSLRSISTASTATEPYSPVTPVTPAFRLSSSSNSSRRDHRPWSICSDDSTSYYSDRPYPRDSEDPFAKGSVQVVPPLKSRQSATFNRRAVISAPVKPAPNIPLPSVPGSKSVDDIPASNKMDEDEAGGGQATETEVEWTLRLGVPPAPPPVVLTPPEQEDVPISNPEPKSEPRLEKVKKKPSKSINLRIYPGNDRDKEDWTLSLPLLPRSHRLSLCPSKRNGRACSSDPERREPAPAPVFRLSAPMEPRGRTTSTPTLSMHRLSHMLPKPSSPVRTTTATVFAMAAPVCSTPKRRCSLVPIPPRTADSTISTISTLSSTSTTSTSSVSTIIPLGAQRERQRLRELTGEVRYATPRQRVLSVHDTRPDSELISPADLAAFSKASHRSSGSHLSVKSARMSERVVDADGSGVRGCVGNDASDQDSDSMVSGTYYSARSSFAM